jgi:CDGSH-type Zn-finger protein
MNDSSIDVIPDGPLKASGIEKFQNSKGENLQNSGSMFLCRCGQSGKKPFCDGKHTKAGFSGKNIRKERNEKYETYEFAGKELTVVDNIGACCHAGFCVKGAPDTFFSWEGDKRISNPDNTDKDTIIKTVRKCPSGSLAYKLDSKLEDHYFSTTAIIASQNGPLEIQGSPELKDPDNAKPQSKEHYTLCRCGASENKPFCDGKHSKVGFVDNEN